MLGSLELVSIVKKRKRVARGGSRGQKSGRGHNGQLSRPGGRSEVRLAFEGGQKSLVLRIPRRGFTSMCKPKLELADLASIAEHFNNGDMVDAAAMID